MLENYRRFLGCVFITLTMGRVGKEFTRHTPLCKQFSAKIILPNKKTVEGKLPPMDI